MQSTTFQKNIYVRAVATQKPNTKQFIIIIFISLLYCVHAYHCYCGTLIYTFMYINMLHSYNNNNNHKHTYRQLTVAAVPCAPAKKY